ncbi:MAG: pilus assembly FimT family protein, partial [Minisyncoccia bacterium]
MKNHPAKRTGGAKGISILEIMFVLGVLGIIFAVVIPQFSSTRENQVLESTTQDIISALNKAQSET